MYTSFGNAMRMYAMRLSGRPMHTLQKNLIYQLLRPPLDSLQVSQEPRTVPRHTTGRAEDQAQTTSTAQRAPWLVLHAALNTSTRKSMKMCTIRGL